MIPETFTTHSHRQPQQADAWRAWFEPVFDVTPLTSETSSFPASNTVWKLNDLVVSRLSAPAVRVRRTPTHIRRSPPDHWVLTYCQRGETIIQTRGGTLQGRPRVPFLW
ncbi:MAG: hypothetical protein JO118_12375, partial [Acetobacteraceae bacterium]|nr:hypothetical protein [Acetobacteraceae bacterium]